MKKYLYFTVSLLIWLSGCAATKSVTPADRVKGAKFYFDCCNPALDEATKWMCKDAAKDEDHVLWDDERNQYIFIWSDCKVGNEPWRKYE